MRAIFQRHRVWCTPYRAPASGAGPAHGRTPVDYSQLDDGMLARLLVARDVGAFEALYDRYSRPVFSLALKMIADREVAEEVVQDVFLRLWTRAYRYDPRRGQLVSWLLTITHHRAIDELRRRRGQNEVEGLQEQLAASEELADDPSESYARVEERESVQQALRHLPEAQRKPIELTYYGGLTQVEIARVLREPLGTVKARKRLGMQKLRLLLRGQLDQAERRATNVNGQLPTCCRLSRNAASPGGRHGSGTQCRWSPPS